MESHPLRMRGLKQRVPLRKQHRTKESHPLRMRGLKLMVRLLVFFVTVASFTDAWIETGFKRTTGCKHLSHPLRMRGLKPSEAQRRERSVTVASFTDAWIETKRGTTTREIGNVSHPLRMRGLKQPLLLVLPRVI